MLAEERIQKIKNYVDDNGSATLNELMELLDSSESTIRRALAEMDKNNLISRVHGGAVSIKNSSSILTIDDELDNRRSLYTEEKRKIAQHAASLINDNDFVYIDSGSTTEFFAEYIEASGATYITNCFGVARILGRKNFNVNLIGGSFKATTEAIVGEEASTNLENYNFTKGFFGTNGIDLKRGFTTPEIREGITKKKAALHSKEKFILADNTKFGVISSYTFAPLDDMKIITTGTISKEYIENTNLTIV